MELTDVIGKVSFLYREERREINNLQSKVDAINEEFQEAVENNWATMTVARWHELNYQRDSLEREIKDRNKRSEGMFDVREMLLDLLDAQTFAEDKVEE